MKFLIRNKKREYSLKINYKDHEDTLDLKKSQEVVFREGEKTKFGPFSSQNRSGKLFGIFGLNDVK